MYIYYKFLENKKLENNLKFVLNENFFLTTSQKKFIFTIDFLFLKSNFQLRIYFCNQLRIYLMTKIKKIN